MSTGPGFTSTNGKTGGGKSLNPTQLLVFSQFPTDTFILFMYFMISYYIFCFFLAVFRVKQEIVCWLLRYMRRVGDVGDVQFVHCHKTLTDQPLNGTCQCSPEHGVWCCELICQLLFSLLPPLLWEKKIITTTNVLPFKLESCQTKRTLLQFGHCKAAC
jgi:hypothetical protein